MSKCLSRRDRFLMGKGIGYVILKSLKDEEDE